MNAVSTFDIAGLVFPIVSGKNEGDDFYIDRFIGSGFWIDGAGDFLTCRHIFEDLKEGQSPAIGQPFSNDRDKYIPIVSSTFHPEYDIAVGRTISRDTRFLEPYEGIIAPGLDVSAFGFTEWGKKDGSLNLDVRFLKGHITRTAEGPTGLPTPFIIETSFGSPGGFSGAPILYGQKVVGMLHGNIESKIQGYSLTEVHDGDKEFRETAYRIHEYGLAHRIADLLVFLESCEINPFQ